jgi:ketosteroid isomerase-like protein
MRRMRLAYLIAFTFACGSTPPKPVAPNAELSTALVPLGWWLGDWQVESGATGSEHWVASSGVIFGIALQDNAAFEVMVLDDGEGGKQADGKLRFFAMPGGMKQTEFSLESKQPTGATFVAPQNDFPKSLTYARDGEALTATIAGDGKSQAFRYKRTTAPRARALEDADIAFAKDVGARGIEGWVAAFDAKGGMMTKAGRVEGADAIRETMAGLLASTKIEWAPIASAARGDVGYTVGKATFTANDGGWKSTYVTIWKKQPDGSWKVLFDTGRTVQAE